MSNWARVPFQLWQRTLHVLARLGPGATSLRVWLHRVRGVRIHGEVFIGANVYIDDAFPQNVTIHENTVIGLSTTLISHSRGRGTVEIGTDAFVGPHCVIMPNVKIGRGAVVAAGSVVNHDVPPFTFVGGVPDAKPLARVTRTLGIHGRREDFQRGLRPLHRRPPPGTTATEPAAEGGSVDG